MNLDEIEVLLERIEQLKRRQAELVEEQQALLRRLEESAAYSAQIREYLEAERQKRRQAAISGRPNQDLSPKRWRAAE